MIIKWVDNRTLNGCVWYRSGLIIYRMMNVML